MDDSSTTTDTLDQADEKILTDTVADEALEAASGAVSGGLCHHTLAMPSGWTPPCC